MTGYVLIANVFVHNVTLEGLKLIRGDTLYYPPALSLSGGTRNTTNRRGYALYVSLNFERGSDTIGMRLLGLKKLAGEDNFMSVYVRGDTTGKSACQKFKFLLQFQLTFF